MHTRVAHLQGQNKILLPKYADCKYSLFISYASRDDEYENNWVSRLHGALYKRIKGGLPYELSRREIYYSKNNSITAGHLSKELEQKIRESFGMLLVVGKHYVESDWCEKELELFGKIFGEKGSESRLFIVAMTKDAIDQATQGDQWKKYLTGDQAWEPMYQKDAEARPLEPGDDPERYATNFFNHASKVADVLIKRITDEVEVARTSTNAPESSRTTVQIPLDTIRGGAPAASDNIRIAIGPAAPPALAARAAELKKLLEKAHATCFQIDRALMDAYDETVPDSVKALELELSRADVLLLPFVEYTPLPPVHFPGGHLHVLCKQWQSMSKKTSPVWYRPHDLKISPETKVAPKHLEFFRDLAPLCESDEAVLSHLFGPEQAEFIKVCIENHPTVMVYETLTEKMDEIWAACLAQEQVATQIPLRCVPLNLDRLDEMPHDVAGVVLVLPLGEKPLESIKNQLEAVEKAFPKAGAAFPGRIALVYSPPPERPVPPVLDWPHVPCKKASDKNPLDLDFGDEGAHQLQMFLGSLLKRYRKAKPTSALR